MLRQLYRPVNFERGNIIYQSADVVQNGQCVMDMAICKSQNYRIGVLDRNLEFVNVLILVSMKCIIFRQIEMREVYMKW